MSPRALAVVIAVWTGCSSTEDVVLDLTDDDPADCADVFDDVLTISLEGIANDGACRIDHQCVFNVDATSVEGLESAMRDTRDLLLELDADQTQQVTINGRPQNNCFPLESGENAPILCGNVNLDERGNGVLRVELQCSGCSDSLALCPP